MDDRWFMERMSELCLHWTDIVRTTHIIEQEPQYFRPKYTEPGKPCQARRGSPVLYASLAWLYKSHVSPLILQLNRASRGEPRDVDTRATLVCEGIYSLKFLLAVIY